ncbi:hypothetical protein DMH04_53465 [Kibdelosporangium aridum]|uniref:Uncharacterized protein n=1 Tax=Kibdelosporangium aridum TaxID=2030 RepID=A0A428Y2W6_KIBAR|nr:hypothetical protein DMH04_53465 [Kibdelosporangium aridum]
MNFWSGAIRSGKTIASLLRWLISLPRHRVVISWSSLAAPAIRWRATCSHRCKTRHYSDLSPNTWSGRK